MRRNGLLLITVALLAGCTAAQDDGFEFSIDTPPCATGEAQESQITAVDLAWGTARWSARVPFVGEFDARLALDGDRLIFPYRSTAISDTTGDLEFTGGMAALTTSGRPMWQRGVGYIDGFGVVDGIVVVGAFHEFRAGEESGIQASDGITAWSHDSEYHHLFLLDGRTALFEADNGLIARDAESGEERWIYSADGISDRGAVAVQGHAIVPVSEGGWYADIDLSSGDYSEIGTATGGSADRVIAATSGVIVGYEVYWSTNAKGKSIDKEAYVAYDRASGDAVWQHNLKNAYAPAWAGDYVVKPGQRIRVIEIATGADAATIPANEMGDFSFAATREHDILIGHDDRITMIGDGTKRTVRVGGSVRGAWEVDAASTLVASTRADGVHLVTMMDDRLESVLWSVELEQPVRVLVVAAGSAYILASNSSCSVF